MTAKPVGWIPKLKYCLIADPSQSRGDLKETVEAALRAGIQTIQLRDKSASTRALYSLALQLRESTRRRDALLIINDRADIALAVCADGVHLGWQSMPAADVRRLIGYERLIGRSVHDLEEARQAVVEGVDYMFAGPVFETPSKAGLVPTLGLDGLRRICREISLPIIGLGGIDPSNGASVRASGASGVAVIRAVLAAEAPLAAARALLEAMK